MNTGKTKNKLKTSMTTLLLIIIANLRQFLHQLNIDDNTKKPQFVSLPNAFMFFSCENFHERIKILNNFFIASLPYLPPCMPRMQKSIHLLLSHRRNKTG